MPGIDLVLPDLTYLREHAQRIEAVVLTHGHEDHTGGLAFLLRDLSVPVFGSALTLGLARHRVEKAGLEDRASFIEVADGERRAIGPFDVEFIPVTHSVPHGFATAFHTPQGVILHSGDFKIDLTPVDGRLTDLARMGALAEGPGVRLLLSDSTNAEEPGYTESETAVGATLQRLFEARASRRVVVTCFASHIHRIQQVMDAARSTGRKVATLGRSMTKNVELARRIGVLHVPDDALIDVEDVDEAEPGEVCVVSTGSQGEPLSALALMAGGESKWLRLRPGDVVVISAHPVPGNEWAVGRVIDGLHRRGAEVIHTGVESVHVSGHARQGELSVLLSVTRPNGSSPCTASTGTWSTTCSWPCGWGWTRKRGCCARTGTRSSSMTTACAGATPFPPASSMSTGRWATWATECCATAASWRRRASWWWWPPSTSTPARW
jgi:ribonuclease J